MLLPSDRRHVTAHLGIAYKRGVAVPELKQTSLSNPHELKIHFLSFLRWFLTQSLSCPLEHLSYMPIACGNFSFYFSYLSVTSSQGNLDRKSVV